MPTRLKGLKLTRIDLVDKGANADAIVALFKRDTEENETVTNEEYQAKVAELEAQVAEITKRADAAEAKLAEADAPADPPDPIAKADPAVRELIAKLEDRAEKSEARVSKMEEERARTEYIAKAQEFSPIMGPADDFGPTLRKIAGVLTDEEMHEFTKRLRSMVEVGKTSAVFKELGVDGEPDEGDKYDQMRKRAVAAYPDDTPETAVTKYLKTDEGRQWYKSAREEK